MRTSIATVSLSGELDQKLAAIAAAGFDAVEIFENDLLVFDKKPRQVGRMVRDCGLEISLFQPFRDFEGMPEPHRRRTFNRAERKFDVMQELGADLVLVCSNVSSIALGGLDRAAADFHDLGERAAKRGLRVGYEALAWGQHIHDYRDAWEIVRHVNHPNVGLILDSFHILARKIEINSIRSIPKEKIFIVQLADAPLIDMDILHWSRHYRNMPGEGDLPVTEFTRAVAATGYDGYYSLEIFNDQFRGGSTRLIAMDGRRSLIYLGDQVRRLEPDAGLAMPDLPDRIKVEGIAFIEFATAEKDAAELIALLHALGFRKTARHKSKSVVVYQQGEIRIVINTETVGFAKAAYNMHGTTAYAVGLKVANAHDAVKRAVGLGAEAFSQPAGQSETALPGVFGPGGGVFYFLDETRQLASVWTTDFLAEQDSDAAAPVGLRTIDHIAQAVRYDELLTAVLFYTSFLEVEKTPVVDIMDPAGVVHSQLVFNSSGGLRVTLNGAENYRTFAGHFIAEHFGSSIQHLAFQTSNIFTTAEALSKNGFRPLAISRNYYDDIEARLGLDPEFAERLRAANILYDRDETGEYFQLCSPVNGEGFFFEIAERRRDYRGYGAANAIFRIAAQKRHARPAAMPRS
ncbi:sugar phosphate isomerase/epimerase and 4-hydroxyphenylpyruvate domain-containing protein [Mesorhizobium sp. B2-4-15]|uniref:bifunctional sugar phosphate isomerase/epimerase/4-hydroxyphenylpyruvate dioxygenase family protein n=1 Tax=unclassified Mesorhizobium TaxID=325217 RepID=UPI001126A938|nr:MULTISPECIES: sugar phosphate isomerase/epimerase and 4-hydroxyphenylpyruvate domain-containing protein [unclassified Mesorhizobium]TPK73538.1 sugar phosphate isomerase/epimerase and 4-hydroxyphenylpyruvate domain-containing protein [Mesorhizobium sp. B2-4-15]TPM24844.1 sugar phosphate isomerase/epimerase and 4-hydroxyphenylpyruvate domain-containing protein [Mesorhizobium sp. B2-3-5]